MSCLRASSSSNDATPIDVSFTWPCFARETIFVIAPRRLAIAKTFVFPERRRHAYPGGQACCQEASGKVLA
eukprot:8664332-Pyramimonas_sp.AAC.1